MEQEDNNSEALQPLSTMEKVGVGVKSFGKAVLHYLPRGILMTAAIFGGLALMANTGMWDPLGLAGMGIEGFIPMVVRATAIGAVLNGGIGAYQGIKASNEARNQQIALQQNARGQERAQGQSQEIDQEYQPGYSPQAGLPNLQQTELVR